MTAAERKAKGGIGDRRHQLLPRYDCGRRSRSIHPIRHPHRDEIQETGGKKMSHPIREATNTIEQWYRDRQIVIPEEVKLQIDTIRANMPKPVRDWLSIEEDGWGPVVRVEDPYGQVFEIGLFGNIDKSYLGQVVYLDLDGNDFKICRDQSERVEVIRDALTAWLESVEKFKEYAEGLK